METTIAQPTRSAAPSQSATRTTSRQSFWERMEFYRFTFVVAILGIVGCLGGITAMYALDMPTIYMATAVTGATLSLSMVIGVAPIKWMVRCAVLAVVADLVIIGISVLA